MATATQLTSTLANGESSALALGTVVRVATANTGRKAQADSSGNVDGILGVAMVGANPGVQFPAALAGDASVLMETGLTLSPGQAVYVSSTVAGRATNVAPGSNVTLLGWIKSANGYSTNQRATVVVTALSRRIGGGGTAPSTTYTPDDAGDWPNPDPTDVQEALDVLADLRAQGAPAVDYTPNTPGNWPNPDPVTVQEALDDLAARPAGSAYGFFPTVPVQNLGTAASAVDVTKLISVFQANNQFNSVPVPSNSAASHGLPHILRMVGDADPGVITTFTFPNPGLWNGAGTHYGQLQFLNGKDKDFIYFAWDHGHGGWLLLDSHFTQF